jgi:hypothetical protein
MEKTPKAATNTKPIPHIPLPFEEVMKDVLKVKPPAKMPQRPKPQKGEHGVSDSSERSV